MKVCVSVGGRFHAFELARYLQQRGALVRLLTSLPKFEVAKYGVSRANVTSLIGKELIMRLHGHLPSSLQTNRAAYIASDWFDRRAAQRLPACDVCTAWSSFGLHTIRKAKRMGAMTVIERGSTHIEFQRDILKEEYGRFGIDMDPIPPGIVEKELQEYSEADYIAIPSGFVRRTFLDRGVPEAKLIHEPYGVSLTQFRPTPKRDKVFRVINVGTQSIQKGTYYLVRAFAELNLPDSELWLVGSIGEELRPLLAPFEGKFRHLGPFPQAELVNFYGQADVFALCSLQEGLAMVQAQAMACGLPVVCTPNTGGEDLIRDGREGFIVPTRDIEALKEKLLFLYQNGDAAKEMGENALRRVRSGFSWDDYGERVLRAYQARYTRSQR